ncbi:MAG: poly(3-hydroxybutyrate) depolymerase [Clostridia bacterium]|nr:poly(3-hydroxybutyrate) depolymerase [Clostridia bacterium]
MKKNVFATLFLALVMMMSCALAAEYTFDPANPYVGVMKGEFNNVAITVEADTGLATYYLPDGLTPWANAAIVLTPDNTTAEAFADSEIGEQWKAVAEANMMAVAFQAPVDGTWNLDGQGADDGAIINQLYFTMRSKSVKLDAPFSMDKTHTALVGYGEGGAAALLFGAEYATDFANITAVDAPAVPADVLAAIGEQVVIPFPADGTQGIVEMNVIAKTVPTPVWFAGSATDAALDYYVAAGKAAQAEANEYAQTVYEAENKAVRIWVSTEGGQTAETIWNAFAGQNKRFMGMADGGRVEFVIDKTTENFTFHEEEVNGETRRWITYVPSSYDGSKAVPVVVSIHGYTASHASMVEESRWHEIAEKEGFIVIYPQGHVRDIPLMGNVPCAMWLGGAFSALAGELDPMTDINFINAILDKTEAAYNVDKSRIYCGGHSNGSMMTFSLAAANASRFAAIAPIGAFSTLEIAGDAQLPVWAMCGEFDSAATPALVEGNATVTMLQSWNAQNGVNEAAPEKSEQYDGQWQTLTFANADGVPMVKFTNVLRTAHIYLPEQPQTVWYEFFSKYSRGEDGTLYYEGNAVNAGAYAADASWYEPAPVEEAK